MSFIMNHDLTSMLGQRFYQRNSLAMRRSLQKLSSGMRLTIADVDNTANLAISETMRSRIASMEKASQNTQDGISLIQTALTAMDQTQSMMNRMRELTVQASNDILTQQDRSYIQVEINELRQEITRLAKTTQFNRKKILSGDNAVLWSTNNTNVKAIVNGGIRSLDQFGQKYAVDGNYNINVKAKEGKAQVQKSNIMTIKHDDVITGKTINTQAGVKAVESENLFAGHYNLTLEDASTPQAAQITSSYGMGDNAFSVSALSGVQDNASILFEVNHIDTNEKCVTLKASASTLSQSGQSSSSLLGDNILLFEGDRVNLGSVSVSLRDINSLEKGAKFVVNVSAQSSDAANSVGVNLETDNFNPGTSAHFVLNNDITDSEIKFNSYYVDSKTGTASQGRVIMTTNENFTSASDGTMLASFDVTHVEERAKGDTRLRDIDRFWNTEGEFMLKEPKEITLTQGDGTQAKIMLYGEDTLNDVAHKLNNAIAMSLGQGKYVDDANNFVTFTENNKDIGLDSVAGTLVMRSVITGKKGEIVLSGNEDLMKAFGLNNIQESRETDYILTIKDMHDGSVIAQDVKAEGNIVSGLIHRNIDIELDPMMGLNAKWDDTKGNFALTSTTGNNGADVTLHLSDNSSIFQTGAGEGEDVILSIGDMSSHALGLDKVNVMTQDLAAYSIGVIDQAIDHVSMQMANLGGAENRLEHHMQQLTKDIEAITDANSHIRDTDYAKEILEFAKMQIVTSTSSAMLAQSNQMQQSSILGLVR
ncbi:MAG: flagellin [Synergistaceae bacterium]|nr:flagellin [Synergistaceae bacterium]MBQ9595821.1 flagellin [Synergistaceae bacterium]